jgi:hypothetical protein
MHERPGAEGRRAHRTAGHEERCAVAERPIQAGLESHQQIMRMLIVKERPAVQRFAHLKHLR